MLNFQGDHARQLLRRERAHGQPLRVRIKRVIGRSRSIGIHQNCGRLNALVARSYYDGLLLGEYPGPSGPITLVNVYERDSPHLPIQQASDRLRRTFPEKRFPDDALKGLTNPDLIELGRRIRMSRRDQYGTADFIVGLAVEASLIIYGSQVRAE